MPGQINKFNNSNMILEIEDLDTHFSKHFDSYEIYSMISSVYNAH